MAQLKLRREKLIGYNDGYAYRECSPAIGVWKSDSGNVYVSIGLNHAFDRSDVEFDVGLRMLCVFMGAYIEQA